MTFINHDREMFDYLEQWFDVVKLIYAKIVVKHARNCAGGLKWLNVSQVSKCTLDCSITLETLKIYLFECFANDEQHKLIDYAKNELCYNISWKDKTLSSVKYHSSFLTLQTYSKH